MFFVIEESKGVGKNCGPLYRNRFPYFNKCSDLRQAFNKPSVITYGWKRGKREGVGAESEEKKQEKEKEDQEDEKEGKEKKDNQEHEEQEEEDNEEKNQEDGLFC